MWYLGSGLNIWHKKPYIIQEEAILSNTKTKIGIICLLEDEYDACKKILGLKNESKIPGWIILERKENNVEVYAIKAGVGKINCSSAT